MRRGAGQVDRDRRGHVPTERLEVAQRTNRPRIDVVARLAETLDLGLAPGVTVQDADALSRHRASGFGLRRIVAKSGGGGE